MFTYDKCVNEEQENYNLVKHISYNKLLAVDNLGGFIDCPPDIPSSAIALKVTDDTMEPTLKCGEYAFIEFNTLLDNKDVGLFCLNGQFLMRKFHSRNGQITLKCANKAYKDIRVTDRDELAILGKVLV